MGKFHANIPRPSLRAGELVPPIRPITGQCSWFYDEDAGGFELPFGKYNGKKIHELPFGYIAWFQSAFVGRRRCEPLLRAASRYKNGLEGHMKDNYGEFLVPLGKVYRGTQIKRVRNKPWMRWLQRWIERRKLKREYGLFIDALQLWLDHPHHQEVKRDIGERTDRDSKDYATEDEEDLELFPKSRWEEDLGDENSADDFYAKEKDVWEKEDLDFINDTNADPMIMNGSDSYVPSESGNGTTSEDSSRYESRSIEDDEEHEEGEEQGEDENSEELNGGDYEDEDSQDDSMQESNKEDQDFLSVESEAHKTIPDDNRGAESGKRKRNSTVTRSSTSDLEDDEPLDVMKERILSTPKKDGRRYPKRRYVQSNSTDISDENQDP